MRTYLDHNATSPLRPSAKAAMLAALEVAGNPSSVHGEGRAARKILDDAREALARALGATAPMVVFTSGGSEANNLALRGVAAERILVSAIEHPSVIEAAKASGKPVEVVAALIGDAKYVLSFDQQTHELRRITHIAPNTFLDYSYDNYFDVNGLKMAADAWIGAGGNKRHVKISKYKINAGIEANKLTGEPIGFSRDAEAELVLKQVEAVRQARLTNNIAALEQLVAEDYVSTNQMGVRRNKAALIQLYSPGNFKPEVFTIENPQVRISGDTAVVVGGHTEKSVGGTLGHQLFTQVWVKREGRWQLLSNTQFVDPNKK